jgi:hypothetical protein
VQRGYVDELRGSVAWVECCARGEGAVVVVSGTAGVGETALLKRTRTLADQRDQRSARARRALPGFEERLMLEAFPADMGSISAATKEVR